MVLTLVSLVSIHGETRWIIVRYIFVHAIAFIELMFKCSSALVFTFLSISFSSLWCDVFFFVRHACSEDETVSLFYGSSLLASYNLSFRTSYHVWLKCTIHRAGTAEKPRRSTSINTFRHHTQKTVDRLFMCFTLIIAVFIFIYETFKLTTHTHTHHNGDKWEEEASSGRTYIYLLTCFWLQIVSSWHRHNCMERERENKR